MNPNSSAGPLRNSNKAQKAYTVGAIAFGILTVIRIAEVEKARNEQKECERMIRHVQELNSVAQENITNALVAECRFQAAYEEMTNSTPKRDVGSVIYSGTNWATWATNANNLVMTGIWIIIPEFELPVHPPNPVEKFDNL